MSASLLNSLRNPFKFRMFLLRKVPMAYLAGIRLKELNEEKSIITVRYKFLTQNPFRSLYFACMAMAAELASGVLSIVHVSKSSQAISMLVVHLEADFTKKAVGKIEFTCVDGKLIQQAIENSIQTRVGQTAVARSIGVDERGDKVAEFRVTWSFKIKNPDKS